MLDVHHYNEKTKTIEKIEFTVLGNKEVLSMSALGKNTQGLLVPDYYENSEPTKNGLVDTRMGVTSNELVCGTCELDTNFCVGHFGHIVLSVPVYHWGFYDHVLLMLKTTCIRCSTVLITMPKNIVMDILKNTILLIF